MTKSFDSFATALAEHSYKWSRYPADTMPLWVADMDFPVAAPIKRSLEARAQEDFFGYEKDSSIFYETVIKRIAARFGFNVKKEEIIISPGLVPALNLAYLTFAEKGEEILVPTPVYSHFFSDPPRLGRKVVAVPLKETNNFYEFDFTALEKAITPLTRVIMLCNPHNPVGRVYNHAELSKIAKIALRYNLIIISDEIHCDLLLNGSKHISTATLAPEVADRTITLMSASKGFNLSGLCFGYVIIQNKKLRERYDHIGNGLLPMANSFGQAATIAAYHDCEVWQNELIKYLEGNLKFMKDFLTKNLPQIKLSEVQGTYLAWLDCRALGQESPGEFFHKKAKVVTMEGSSFGAGGKGFIRLNFACPRARLEQSLMQMSKALE